MCLLTELGVSVSEEFSKWEEAESRSDSTVELLKQLAACQLSSGFVLKEMGQSATGPVKLRLVDMNALA